jgi:hypothetical protein
LGRRAQSKPADLRPGNLTPEHTFGAFVSVPACGIFTCMPASDQPQVTPHKLVPVRDRSPTQTQHAHFLQHLAAANHDAFKGVS